MGICDSCIYFESGHCTGESGVYYGEEVPDPLEDIDCNAYIDNYMAFTSIPEVQEMMGEDIF